MRPIEIDGRTGEGGGQLVRNAIALAAVTSQPVTIMNVRGNRPGTRGGGLKSQHVTSIAWLAKATGAVVKGLQIGSKTLTFSPRHGPGKLSERNIKIHTESPAASAPLVFQAVFPFLLLAGNEHDEPIDLTISGGTNVSFSLSYDYLDQVLLPTLEDSFGVRVERKLQNRGWSSGSASRGSMWFKIHPLPRGSSLKLGQTGLASRRSEDVVVESIHATILTPSNMHLQLERVLREDLGQNFPGASLHFEQTEESGHESRIYVLLVATSGTLRWGRDFLYNRKRKGKTPKVIANEVSSAVTKAMCDEIWLGGTVDEFLQDQLVIFQALAEGKTSFPRRTSYSETSQRQDGAASDTEVKFDSSMLDTGMVRGLSGDSELDSTHTMTARWVASVILEPKVKWYSRGTVCEGIGLVSGCDEASS